VTSSADSRNPRVSIGLPVFNGERFLERAVQSILDQDFRDFELVISDNGSTDGTPELARAFAAADDRVSFLRHDPNRGASWNFNHVVAVTSAPLFKWAAHDDELRPSWLGQCVAALDEAPGATVAYTRRLKIDADGNPLKTTHERPKRFLASDSRPGERFADILARTTSCIEIFGVIRRSALEQTRQFLPFAAADRILLAELTLLGHFVEVPAELFLHREHEGRSIRQTSTAAARDAWFDPSRADQIALPTWRLGWEYARVVRRSSLPRSERTEAYRGLARWLASRRRLLADNLVDAVHDRVERARSPARA
jgi:glycosyltransferase involved in cell wall biosynthesis